MTIGMRSCSIVAILALLPCIGFGTPPADAQSKRAEKQNPQGKFANIRYEQLATGQWKTLHIGKTNDEVNLPSGKSYYIAFAVPPIDGTVELRPQTPIQLKEIHDCLMPCVTFLDAEFRPTHSFDYREAHLSNALGWTFNDRTVLQMRVSKKITDRYMIVHTDARIVGSVIKYDFGHRTTTSVPVGKYNYLAPGPSSLDLLATAKGKLYVKLFPQ